MTHPAPKVALVTGAGTGIGRAASMALAAEGFFVVAAGRRVEPLAAVVAEITGAGHQALPAVADITQEASVRELFATIQTQCGRLDLLFNNAGTNTRSVPLEELTIAEWRQVLDINLTGAFLCTQQAIRLMKQQSPRGGRIINNGSVSAAVPRLYNAPYTASKHAMTGLTKATALEGRPFDIACGQIDIGNVQSAIGAHAARGALQADGTLKAEAMMELANVAQAVCYMASLPLSANVLSMTVMATQMPLIGRG